MSLLRSIFRQNNAFFAGALTFLLTGLALLALDCNQALTSHSSHPFWMNVFFVNYTFIGDAFFATGVCFIFLVYLRRKKEGYTLLLSFLFSMLLIQLVKNIDAANGFTLFVEDGQYLFPLNGDAASDHTSLPSGHTALAFSLAATFIVIIRNKNWQLPILAAAILVAISRVYLAGHLLSDVLSGAAIGLFSSIVAVSVVKPGMVSQGKKPKAIGFPAVGNTIAYS
jgi:membrane-associated phospholipid phosphatase